MRAANAGQAMSIVLADEFARCGLTDACLAPGSRSGPLATALAADPHIRIHVQIDERSAAFLALGIAKASRRPAAVLSTSGTAAANMYPAVIEAHHSRTPLLVLTADRPPQLRDTGANQTIDQLKLYGSAVRWFFEVGVPEARPESVRYWRSLACRAFARATGPQAGPVHLNLAFREPLVPVPDEQGFPYPLEGRPEERSWTRVARSLRPPSEADVDRLAGEIAGASRGLILVGDGQADASAVLELARAAEWPVLADPLSGARCGEFAVSTYEALLSVLPFVRSHRPEMVVRIGRVSPSRRMAEFLNHRVKQILLDVGGVDEGWSDPERGASWAVEADPSMVCQAVAKALLPRSDRAWLDSWLGSESRARNAIDALLDATDEPSEPRVARDLCRILPEGATLVVASSMPVRDVEWFMLPRSGLRVLGNRGASGIDGFVSTSLGVAMASPGPTFALAGDLSLLHDANGLLAARSERNAPVEAIIVVVNNNGGAIFSFLPEADFPENFERLFGTPHDLDLADVARLYKCGYQKVERMSRFAAALAAARRAGGVNILEVPTDRQANVAHHRMLWEAVAGALGH